MAEAARAANILRESYDTYVGRPRQRDRRIGTIHISRLRAPTLTQPQRQPSTPTNSLVIMHPSNSGRQTGG